MNILFTNNVPFNPQLGGIERVTDIITKELIARGYNVFYLCKRIPNNNALDYDFPTKQHVLHGDERFHTKKDIKNYHSYIEQNKINIVINQKCITSIGNLYLDTGNNYCKKISVIHNSPLAACGRINRGWFDDVITLKSIMWVILKISIVGYPLKKIMDFIKYRKQYAFLFKASDAVVLLSDKFRKDLKKVYPFPGKIFAISNPNSFSLNYVDYNKKKKEILFVGRLDSDQKRVDRLIKVWKLLFNKHIDWELIIVGVGAQEKELKRYIKKHRILRVRFEGEQKNVIPYYETASFISLTSSYEGWPMVLSEGMMYGCVPITFNSYASITDIIDDKNDGIIIKAFDIKEYAKRLSELMTDDITRLKIAKKAHGKIKNFSIENIIVSWENLFKKLTT